MAKKTVAQINSEMQAQWDAQTLAQAAEIQSDKPRARRAVKSAKQTAAKAQKAVKTISKAAKVTPSKPKPRKKKK